MPFSFDGNGHLVRTTTAPDGGTRIETYYKDGQLKEISGTTANPVCYEYDVEAGGACTQSFYNNSGQLWKSRDPDDNVALSTYNPRGEHERGQPIGWFIFG